VTSAFFHTEMYVCSHERIEANNYTRVVQRIFHKYKKKPSLFMPNLENHLYNQGSCFVGPVSISRVIQLRTHDEKLVLGPGAASAGGGERIKVRRYRR
jgi:hypothetical protein